MLNHRSSERASVLLLMPAAIMIVVVLGALAVDVGLSRVRARELRFVAASAANDALAGLDVAALRSDGTIRIDVNDAREIVSAAVATGPLPEAEIESVSVAEDALGRLEITVRLSLDVELLIAPAIPGSPGSVRISATESVVVVS